MNTIITITKPHSGFTNNNKETRVYAVHAKHDRDKYLKSAHIYSDPHHQQWERVDKYRHFFPLRSCTPGIDSLPNEPEHEVNKLLKKGYKEPAILVLMQGEKDWLSRVLEKIKSYSHVKQN